MIKIRKLNKTKNEIPFYLKPYKIQKTGAQKDFCLLDVLSLFFLVKIMMFMLIIKFYIKAIYFI